MKSYAAIQTEYGKELVIDAIEIPDPQPHQVVVKMFSTGVCHSQLHQMKDPKTTRPYGFGHEATGVVTQVGNDVGHVKEGDHCIVTWVPRNPFKGRPDKTPPGATYKGELINCAWAFTWSQDCIIDGEYVVKISNDEPVDVSCIIGCAVLTGAGAVINTANVKTGESVAVFGVGGVGLSAIKMASIIGAYPIIAVDLLDDKLTFAKEFGATHLINASKSDPVNKIVDLTDGGVDYAFDAVGIKITNEQILPSTRGGGPGADNIGGTAVLIGIPGPEMTLDPGLFMFGQRIYKGSLGATYPEKEFPMYLRLHSEGKFDLDKLITKRYKFEQMIEAYKDLDNGKIFGRAIIEF